MKIIHMEGKLTCLTPIHHSSFDDTGNTVTLRRFEWYTNKGLKEIPYIEGNSIRGKLRRLVMKDFVDRVGFMPTTPRFYHLLFSGGKLEKVKSNEVGLVNLEMRRLVAELIPPLGIFGTAWLNQTIGGHKMKVGKALPVCSELNGMYYDSKRYGLEDPPSFYDLTSDTTIYHWDELKAKREADENPYQMFIEKECFIPGTIFTHEFYLKDATPPEEGFFRNMIDLWNLDPFIGANSGTGFGKLRIEYFGDVFDSLEPSETYFEHIEANRDEIINIFEILDKSLARDTKSIKIAKQDEPSHKEYNKL